MSKLEKWFLFFCIFTTGVASTQTDPKARLILFILALAYGIAFVVSPNTASTGQAASGSQPEDNSKAACR